MRGAFASRHMGTKPGLRTRPLFERLNTYNSARPSPAFGTLPGRAQRARRSNDLRGMPRQPIVLTPACKAREWNTHAS